MCLNPLSLANAMPVPGSSDAGCDVFAVNLFILHYGPKQTLGHFSNMFGGVLFHCMEQKDKSAQGKTAGGDVAETPGNIESDIKN
jgi:hypothetical protein